MAIALLTACGSDKPASTRGETSATSPSPSPEPVLDTISYDGTVTSGTGPGSRHKQPVGIFCAPPEGQDCNLTGLTVGNHNVLGLSRDDEDSFTVDMPASTSTCSTRGTSAVTGTIELSSRSMTMTLKSSGEKVPCPDGDITYLPATYKFKGQYVDGGLPGFTVGRGSVPKPASP